MGRENKWDCVKSKETRTSDFHFITALGFRALSHTVAVSFAYQSQWPSKTFYSEPFVMISPNIPLAFYRNSSLRQKWEGTASLPGVRQESDEVQGIILELITHFCTMGNTNLLCLKPVWRKFLAAKGKRNMILLYKNSWQYYTKNSPKFRHFRLNPAYHTNHLN